MSRFFHFYEDKNRFDNIHHKAQFLVTAFMPLLFMILAVLMYISLPIALIGVIAIAAMYLTGLSRSIIPALRNRTGIYSPLLVSSASGPLYLAALFLVDPSLSGIGGLILVFGIPAVLLVPLFIDLFKNSGTYDDSELSDNTEEIQKVSL